MRPEQQARQKIDAQLFASGWIVQDYSKMDLSAGRGIVLGEVALMCGRCLYHPDLAEQMRLAIVVERLWNVLAGRNFGFRQLHASTCPFHVGHSPENLNS
jgi:hypothetical protein